jgi:tetratricopeptide (TPR) repeat protein
MKARSLIQIPAVATVLLVALFAGCAEEEREVTTTSDAAYICYEDGTAAVERFRLEKAEECFRDAVKHDPEFSMAWAELAVVQRQLGQVEAAQESIRRAFEARETATEVEALWISRIHALFERDMETAEANWKELEAKYPEHPRVLRLRAEFAKQNNDFDLALACYDKLLEKDPDAVAVHNLKGYLYLQQGNYEEAVLSLQRYAYYAPDQANPHDSLGEAFLYIGRYDEAISEFQISLRIDPTFHWSARNLATALSITGQRKAAVKVLQNYRPLFEERNMLPRWDQSRSMIAFRAEDWEQVLDLTDKSLERLAEVSDYEYVEYELFARYARTIALLETGRQDAALEAASELERVAQRINEMGSIAKLKRPQQIMAINEAIVIARLERADGKPAEGIAGLEAAIAAADLSPHELAFPIRELAVAYLAAGQPEEASAAARRILEAIPTAPELNLVAARAEAAAGNRDEALAFLQTYLDVMRNADPGYRQVSEATALVQQLTPRS